MTEKETYDTAARLKREGIRVSLFRLKELCQSHNSDYMSTTYDRALPRLSKPIQLAFHFINIDLSNWHSWVLDGHAGAVNIH
jgi:hypothetical protein